MRIFKIDTIDYCNCLILYSEYTKYDVGFFSKQVFEFDSSAEFQEGRLITLLEQYIYKKDIDDLLNNIIRHLNSKI